MVQLARSQSLYVLKFVSAELASLSATLIDIAHRVCHLLHLQLLRN